MSNNNFYFIEKFNLALYMKLVYAEEQSRVNFRSSGHATREAMEELLKSIINSHKLLDIKELDIYSKIRALKDEYKILPEIGDVQFKCENGKNKKMNYYNFMRMYGNVCSHIGDGSNGVKIKIDYSNTVKCLKGYHILLKKYYKDRIPDKLESFNENLMPIGRYQIYDSYIPKDHQRSKCNREFLAYYYEGSSKGRKSYAILRMYNKIDINENFMLRNINTFDEVVNDSVNGLPNGMTIVRQLTDYKKDDSSFYIIAYIFRRKPVALTNKVLTGLDLKNRVDICKRISDCFLALHTLESPIYHRMFSYESVWLSDYSDKKVRWIPNVIKFDFAKMNVDYIEGTVFNDAVKASKYQDNIQQKYVSKEWGMNAEWDKVDIYSLGVLFSDLLYGEISSIYVEGDDLEELNISDELLDLIDDMRNDNPENRPTIEEVQLVLDEEMKRWS